MVFGGHGAADGRSVVVLTDGDYRAVFEASPDPTLVVDSNGVIRDLNPQALALFGWSREEMEGCPVERLMPAASRDRHREHRRAYVEAPRARPMGRGRELWALRRDGTTVPVEISLSPGRLPSGRELVICTVRDITGWKRMRQLSRAMVTAVENERKRLSRELHDEFLQSLVALKIRVKLLAAEPAEEERSRAREQIAREIDDTIRGVKRMIRGLLPPELDSRRLSSALDSVFRDLRDVYGFTVRSSVDPVDGELDADAALALYRIVQEAVTNTVRHAGVREAMVTVRSEDAAVTAEIRDEGVGFEFDGLTGLTSMRERAALVGGHIAVDTAPGRGTAIRVTVPVADPEERRGPDRW